MRAIKPKIFWLSDLNVNTGIQEVRLAFTYAENGKVIGPKIDVIELDPALKMMKEMSALYKELICTIPYNYTEYLKKHRTNYEKLNQFISQIEREAGE